MKPILFGFAIVAYATVYWAQGLQPSDRWINTRENVARMVRNARREIGL